MDTLEDYEIYKAFKTNLGNVLNDQLSFRSHYLFDTALKFETQDNTR